MAKSVEFDVSVADGDALSFRLDLLSCRSASSLGRFRVRLFRYDLFRLAYLGDGMQSVQVADHEIMILDSTFGCFDIAASSAEEALEQAMNSIAARFAVN